MLFIKSLKKRKLFLTIQKFGNIVIFKTSSKV